MTGESDSATMAIVPVHGGMVDGSGPEQAQKETQR
jgi:hypothetical protein